jgi:hypothetical protein
VIQFVGDLRQVGCFSPATPVSSTNKTDRHDITEILLKVSLNTITLILTFISKYATGAILQNTRIDLHNLFNIRCLLYLFSSFLFWRYTNIWRHPVWSYIRIHIFNWPINDEPTKSSGIKAVVELFVRLVNIFNCLAKMNELCCLVLFDIRILITLLVSLNSSYLTECC